MRGAQRSESTLAAACHAVYREPGGVPTPPNLRPFSRAVFHRWQG